VTRYFRSTNVTLIRLDVNDIKKCTGKDDNGWEKTMNMPDGDLEKQGRRILLNIKEHLLWVWLFYPERSQFLRNSERKAPTRGFG